MGRSIKIVEYDTYYNNRVLMSFDRNLFPYRLIIGRRSFGKTYSFKNMLCNFYHKVKHLPEGQEEDLFVWSRLTDSAIGKLANEFLEDSLEKKHNIKATTIQKKGYAEVYFNGRLMGHLVALQHGPIIKGGTWQHKRYKYFILDEFQRERKERRTFDIVYNLRSVLESMTRFKERIKDGRKYPYVIMMGNTVDEATDILYSFDFLPMEYGVHILKKKNIIIEYGKASDAYVEMERRDPLRHLNVGNDLTSEEIRFEDKMNVLDPLNTGARTYVGHLAITNYITLEVWRVQKNNSLYISRGLETNKFQNRTYTLHRLAANQGTIYTVDFHKLIRRYYNNNNIYFDKRITASIFTSNVV